MDEETAESCARYAEMLEPADRRRLAFATKIWEIQDQVDEFDSEDALDSEEVMAALYEHQPVFDAAPPKIEASRFAKVADMIAAVLAEDIGLSTDSANALHGADFGAVIALDRPLHNLETFMAEAGRTLAPEGNGQAGLMRFVVAASLTPFLREHAKRALKAVERFDWTAWPIAVCPACGSPAALGIVTDTGAPKGGRRTLWCSLCGTDWEFERVRCARCGTRDHDKLHYLMDERDPAHRIHVCDECHGYLKVVFAQHLDGPPVPRVEDVVTLPLDALAHSKGYK